MPPPDQAQLPGLSDQEAPDRPREQLDRAVLNAYGQSCIEVPPYVGAIPEQLERFQDQVLDFLFARNALLAKREAAAQSRARV